MAISEEILRIQTDRNTIRTKLLALGLAESTDNLDDLASAINGIANKGTPDAEVKEGETYTILEGYYKGGTVRGVAGGGHYELQAKSNITPDRTVQTITPDSGFYGLSSVQINAIPSSYQDVSAVSAGAGDVLANKVIVNSTGAVAGTMPNNGAITRKLDVETDEITIPAGYHNGSGTVSVDLEEKTATPSTSAQSIVPTTGKLLKKVTVNPIPDNYVNLDDYEETNAAASNILTGKTVYGKTDEDGFEKIEGTMPNNGGISATLDVSNTSKSIPAGYTSGGAVSIALEEKSATPSASAQNITPSTGKVLSKVVVNAIPSNYVDSSTVDAIAGNVLAGKKAVVKDGASFVVASGTMVNNGTISGTFDGLTVTSYTIPAGYTSGGTVSLTDDIEEALSAI